MSEALPSKRSRSDRRPTRSQPFLSAFADFLEERGAPRSRYLRDDRIRPWMGDGFGDPLPALIDAVRLNRKFAAARKALVAVGAAAVEPLAALLAEDEETCIRAAKILGAIGEAARPAVPALLAVLGDEGWEDRVACANALAAIRPGPDTDIGYLVRALGADDDVLVTAVRRVLAGIGALKSVTDELLRRLREGDEDERANAVDAVANLGTKAAVSRLWPSLSDPSPQVRAAAVSALGRFPSDQRIEGALLAALVDANDGVRASAAEALGSAEGAHSPAVVEGLRRALSDPREAVRLEAISSIGGATESTISDILGLVRDPHPYIRGEAVQALFFGPATTHPAALSAAYLPSWRMS